MSGAAATPQRGDCDHMRALAGTTPGNVDIFLRLRLSGGLSGRGPWAGAYREPALGAEMTAVTSVAAFSLAVTRNRS